MWLANYQLTWSCLRVLLVDEVGKLLNYCDLVWVFLIERFSSQDLWLEFKEESKKYNLVWSNWETRKPVRCDPETPKNKREATQVSVVYWYAMRPRGSLTSVSRFGRGKTSELNVHVCELDVLMSRAGIVRPERTAVQRFYGAKDSSFLHGKGGGSLGITIPHKWKWMLEKLFDSEGGRAANSLKVIRN